MNTPHPEGVPDLMGDLEAFWYNETIAVPHLVRLTISHYQFETIHPFLDGNGRISRLMIPVYLVSHGLLAKLSLYLFDFFEHNRMSYWTTLFSARKGITAFWSMDTCKTGIGCRKCQAGMETNINWDWRTITITWASYH